MEVVRTGQTDEPVSQVLALKQGEDRDDEHDHRRFKRTQYRREDRSHHDQRGVLGLDHLDRDGTLSGPGGRSGRRRDRAWFQRPAHPDRSADCGHPRREERLQSFDLLLDGAGVTRRVGRERRRLAPDQGAHESQRAQRHEHGDNHRGRSLQPGSTEQTHERPEDEGENHRKNDRDEDVLGHAQRRDRQRGDQYSEQVARFEQRGCVAR
jgi:hypothetical protein